MRPWTPLALLSVAGLIFGLLSAPAATAATNYLRVYDALVTEGNADKTVSVKVQLSRRPSRRTTVNLSTFNQTATAPADYTAKSTTVVFPAGVRTKMVPVTVKGDALDEVDETFGVRLTNPTRARIADGTGVVTISDNDGPGILVGDRSLNEGWTANKLYQFTVSLSAPSVQEVRVNYASANGTASAPSDYTALEPGTLTFLPGQTSKTLTVLGQGDLTPEGNETFFVNLSSPVDGVIVDGQGLGTISNDDFASTDGGPLSALNIGGVSGDQASPGVTSGLNSIQLGDADWYKVTLNETFFDFFSGEDLWARVQLIVNDYPAQTGGDIDMQVYRLDGTTLVTSSGAGGTADEQAFVRVPEAPMGFFTDPNNSRTFLVKVYGYGGSVMNDYTLNVNGDLEGTPSGTIP